MGNNLGRPLRSRCAVRSTSGRRNLGLRLSPRRPMRAVSRPSGSRSRSVLAGCTPQPLRDTGRGPLRKSPSSCRRRRSPSCRWSSIAGNRQHHIRSRRSRLHTRSRRIRCRGCCRGSCTRPRSCSRAVGCWPRSHMPALRACTLLVSLASGRARPRATRPGRLPRALQSSCWHRRRQTP